MQGIEERIMQSCSAAAHFHLNQEKKNPQRERERIKVQQGALIGQQRSKLMERLGKLSNLDREELFKHGFVCSFGHQG